MCTTEHNKTRPFIISDLSSTVSRHGQYSTPRSTVPAHCSSLTILCMSKLLLQLDDKQFEGKDQTFRESEISQGQCIHPCIFHRAVHTAGTHVRPLSLLNYTWRFSGLWKLVYRSKGMQVRGPTVRGSEQRSSNSAAQCSPGRLPPLLP